MSGSPDLVALVDCGGANIASLRFALQRLGVEARFTRDAAEIESADKVFLPGVGAAGSGMAKLRIPHMGWNQVLGCGESKLLNGIPSGAWFYFVHSYAAPPGAHCVAETEHGAGFASVVEKSNFFGVQFHPERSGANGQRLLMNFLAA